MHTVPENNSAGQFSPTSRILLIAVVAFTVAGCLCLGGKTTYVQSTETDTRVQALEARVATLEQALENRGK